MSIVRTVCTALLICCGASLRASPLLAQNTPETVELILSRLPAPVIDELGGVRPSPVYGNLGNQAGNPARQVLPLTRSEVWTLPGRNVDAFKKAAAEHGIVVTELGADWNRLFRLASADMIVSEQQRSLMRLARAS